MDRTPIHVALFAALISIGTAGRQPTEPDFQKDFDTAWQQIGATYAYFDVKATRWNDIPLLYRSDVAKVHNKRDFIGVLERVLDELYDPHAQLTINTAVSPRLVPSGADLWAEWQEQQAVITDVRAGSDAERAGIRPGSMVASIDGVPISEAVSKRLGRSYPQSEATARDWALRAVLAGTHNTARKLQVRQASIDRTIELPGCDQFAAGALRPVTISRLESGAAHIVFNDSLGDPATVCVFRSIVNTHSVSR